MERICVLIKYTVHDETASYTWDYAGGCFEANGYGSDIKYASISPGETHKFDNIPIEVRQISTDAVAESLGTSSSGSGFLWLIYFVCVLLFLVSLAALLFKLYM